MTTYSIPLYQPDLSGNEKRYVLECLNSTWISSKGDFISEFENRFAAYVGARHAAAVCNGTAALHVALLALGIGPGDEVIVPTLTYIAAVNAIAYTGATPVFVDSRRDTWQMDSADVQRKITSRTKALMVVHLYGHPCELEALKEIARKRELFVVEDCAEALGARYKGQLVGTFGDIAAFSFYGKKTITTGEGGMIITNDPTLVDSAKHFKGQGLAARHPRRQALSARDQHHAAVGRLLLVLPSLHRSTQRPGLRRSRQAEELAARRSLLPPHS